MDPAGPSWIRLGSSVLRSACLCSPEQTPHSEELRRWNRTEAQVHLELLERAHRPHYAITGSVGLRTLVALSGWLRLGQHLSLQDVTLEPVRRQVLDSVWG